MHLAQLHNINSPSTIFTTSDYLPSTLVARILLFSLFIAGFIFFIRLISAGFIYLTANGEPAKIQAATKSLTNAVIGLIVVVSAYFIAQIIQTIFGLRIL